MILWNGTCQVHENFSEREIVRLKIRHPKALVLAHPECHKSILRHADVIGSTTTIIKTGTESKFDEFIIVTEPDVIHQMQKIAPEKTYHTTPNQEGCACNECPHMRVTPHEKMISVLEYLQPQIYMDEELRLRALKPLEKMFTLS